MEKIRIKKRRIKAYLLLSIMLLETFSTATFALTSGPATPEVQSFAPIDHTQMVDLFSGDFSYNIPLFELPGPNGGYPFNLAYSSSGVSMDTEATWVGLGWSLNPGAINRQMRGIPDDFKGDPVKKFVDMKKNWTAGVSFAPDLEIVSVPVTEHPEPDTSKYSLKLDIGLYYNSYKGLGINLGANLPYKKGAEEGIGKFDLGLRLNSQDGVGLDPSYSLSDKKRELKHKFNAGIDYNSKKGLGDLSLGYKIVETNNIDKENTTSPYLANYKYSFASSTYIPSSTLPWTSKGYSLKFKFGPSAPGIFPNARLTGYYQEQDLQFKTKEYKAYGYNHSPKDSDDVMLDVNREKDGALRKESPNLGIPHFTADTYSIQGQGVGGMFRAFRNDVGVLHDPELEVKSGFNFKEKNGSVSLGFDAGPPVHGAADFSINFTTNRSGKWNHKNQLHTDYHFKSPESGKLFEPVYYKMVGEKVAENLTDIDSIGDTEPLKIELDKKVKLKRGGAFDKFKNSNGSTRSVSSKIEKRKPRGQVILSLTNEELLDANDEVTLKEFEYIHNGTDVHTFPSSPQPEDNKGHHVGAFQVLTTNGMRYNYGLPVYNRKQIEQQFSIPYEKSDTAFAPIKTQYSSSNNINPDYDVPGTDKYSSRTTLPAYTTAHLLTNVLGHDYIDVTKDGVTCDDYGYFVGFRYKKLHESYKWRAPFYGANKNLGFFSNLKINDDKASYMYGERENFLLDTAFTSTHYAVFYSSHREDARGAYLEYQDSLTNQHGEYSHQLDSIKLFSKRQENLPIKTVHFEYSDPADELCQGVWNNENGNGKLTLKKVWFTYQNNCRGALSPYQFNYYSNNPNYHTHSVDRWGTYRQALNAFLSIYFPYSKQFDANDTAMAANTATEASAWLLNEIKLPSGGKINVEYEADDYYKVQDREATQMFQIHGLQQLAPGQIGEFISPFSNTSNSLFRRVYFKLEKDQPTSTPKSTFKDLYLRDLNKDEEGRDQIYFKILIALGSNGKHKEFVSGYASIKDYGFFQSSGSSDYDLGYIELGFTKIGKKKKELHPFFLAAAQKRRVDLPDLPLFGNYNQYEGNGSSKDLVKTLRTIANSIGALNSIFKNYNQKAYDKGWGQELKLDHSWIKLNTPDRAKTGGGSRVKKVTMNDNWNEATKLPGSSNPLFQIGETSSEYGQIYDYYTRDDAGNIIRSNGVAANEPSIGGDESPLKGAKNYPEKITLSSNNNLFFEYPINEDHYPGASVGYEKVTVQTTAAAEGRSNTGYSVHEYFTANDFPIITEETSIDKAPHSKIFIPIPLLGKITKKRMTASQGYSIQLNDMHGKSKKVSHYKALRDCQLEVEPISWIKYNYHSTGKSVKNPLTGNRKTINVLTNEVDVLLDNIDLSDDSKAHFKKMRVGSDYEFYTDMRENRSNAWDGGLNANVDIFFIPVPVLWPNISNSTTEVRVAATNKIIRQCGIMKSTEAFDQGSYILTENLAYDQYTGQALLSSVNNHFDDPIYSYKTPARWSYDGMGTAYKTIGLKFNMQYHSAALLANSYTVTSDLDSEAFGALEKGAEFLIEQGTTKNRIYLLDKCPPNKLIINSDQPITGSYDAIVTRSGRRNQLDISNSSYTALVDPTIDRTNIICDGYDTTVICPSCNCTLDSTAIQFAVPMVDSILQTSAISFTEYRLPSKFDLDYCMALSCGEILEGIYNSEAYCTGEKGIWRPHKTFAYLKDRNQTTPLTDLRRDGCFSDVALFDFQYPDDFIECHPYWKKTNEITRYSPNSFVLEEKDILNNYSAAQYGYGDSNNDYLPVAVGYDMQYTDMYVQDFEDEQEVNALGISTASFPIHTGNRAAKIEENSPITFTVPTNEFKPQEGKEYFLSCWFRNWEFTNTTHTYFDAASGTAGVTINFLGTSAPPVEIKPVAKWNHRNRINSSTLSSNKWRIFN